MKNILIIEDERTFANILGELIEDDGFKCTVTYSAAEAEKHFPQLGKEIGAVVLDLMMTRTGSFAERPLEQGETGDELFLAIREIAPAIPIAIVTAKTKESIARRYYEEKQTRVFLKPINPETIAQLVSFLKSI